MRIEMDTPVDVLVHGDNISYIDLDEDEILHWQYIRREKLPNGKYRYYYNEKELNKYKNDAEQATKNAEKAKSKYGTAYYKYGRAKEAEGKAHSNYRNVLNNGKSNIIDWIKANDIVTRSTANAKTAKKDSDKAKREYEKATRNAQKLVKKYERKKVTSFVSRAVSKGIVAVANWLNGIRD